MNFKENVYAFIKDLKYFHYKIESIDHIWDILLPDNKQQWHYIGVVKYEDTYYIQCVSGKLCSLEVKCNKSVEAVSSFGSRVYEEGGIEQWEPMIDAARKWLKIVQKDWIKANKKAHVSYPLKYRHGIVSNALVRASLNDIYRIDQELGKEKTKKFIQLVESRYFWKDENTTRKTMTLNDYFEYCKIAYIAGQRDDDHVDTSISGREMYKRYADGREGGLLELEPDSTEDFANWLDGKHPKQKFGAHPWEIKRGGNTTHIDLYVIRPSYQKEGFQVTLRGASIGRLKETICMFLAIYEAGLPITIADPESIRKRLIAADNIGIIPSFDSLHRANQHFHQSEDVYDVLHFDHLGRYKRRITPFITWEPLPLLVVL